MAGMDLAGGYGAGGMADALERLIAQRIAHDKFVEANRQWQAQQDAQTQRDQLARETLAFNQDRARKTDERQARLDDESRETKLTREAVDMATLFPGATVSGEDLQRYPGHIAKLIAKPKPEQLASREISGFSTTAGTPQDGELTTEEHEAVGPDAYELQLPISEKMRIAQERQSAASTKADADRELATRRLDEQRAHNERMEALRAMQAGRGSERTVKLTYEDPETGAVVEEFVSPDEAKARGKIRVPSKGAGKPATGAERQTLAYFNRAKDAIETLTRAPQGPAGLKLAPLEERIAQQGMADQLRGQYAPNMLQGEDQQTYRQAQRAFTEARLRKESGAAIPTAEFENDARTYFVQPGDSKAVIAQKRKARQVVLDGLKFAAGRAYDEFYGGGDGDPTAGGAFASPDAGDGGGTVKMRAPDGSMQDVPAALVSHYVAKGAKVVR